jgi:hypothetical protein
VTAVAARVLPLLPPLSLRAQEVLLLTIVRNVYAFFNQEPT